MKCLHILLVLDPSWASINRGVLLCNECCSVHRVMGTHISHVRALGTNWPPMLKEVRYSSHLAAINTHVVPDGVQFGKQRC